MISKNHQEKIPAIDDVMKLRETVWRNDSWKTYELVKSELPLTENDIVEASHRMERFAPYIEKCFPETKAQGGLIESPLKKIEGMQEKLGEFVSDTEKWMAGNLFLKMDSHLAIAGSVKARGGIYEILKHTEELAYKNKLMEYGDSYEKLADFSEFFSKYSIQVGSTGNLGLSIGIISAKIGYRVVVHMSADAKQWKKELLRSKGVIVKEYEGDYEAAVAAGRKLSDQDPMSYFVDDEHSKDLFLGYSVAAYRLQKQLSVQEVAVDKQHPLFVYIPCGVGGAPGGITFGLKTIFGDHVHCFFVEPTQCPCMLLGLATGKGEDVCVQDFGLTGNTHADGLAVGRPSPLVSEMMKHVVSGIFTVKDYKLYEYMRMLKNSEDIVIEPSSCAAFEGYVGMGHYPDMLEYIKEQELADKMENATHIVWATGGKLVPEENVKEYLETVLPSV